MSMSPIKLSLELTKKVVQRLLTEIDIITFEYIYLQLKLSQIMRDESWKTVFSHRL